VETTGKTVEAAKEAALDQLGVAEDDAEFELLAEPKAGLFGFLRGEARVRARVRPTRPRPKVERRDRRRRRAGQGQDGERVAGGAKDKGPGRSGEVRSRRRGGGGTREGAGDARQTVASDPAGPGEEETDVASELSPKEQASIVAEFLDGLLDAFGLEGALSQEAIDDDTLEVRIEGDDLGILIGPRGQTLQAVQELGRAAVQRRLAGGREARVRVDVAGYRQRRREALERFVRGVAEDVLASGVAKALEPMSPPDRKIVHDTVNELAGVGTVSEGEEPHRRVIIVPVDQPTQETGPSVPAGATGGDGQGGEGAGAD